MVTITDFTKPFIKDYFKNNIDKIINGNTYSYIFLII